MNNELILRQRITILTAEVYLMVILHGTENKPSLELVAKISEMDDLNGQLEVLSPPSLVRQVAGIAEIYQDTNFVR